tara:strand:+ start:25 stop:177 length:153 start_codon:yes stop_codon:yes gene_type:complete
MTIQIIITIVYLSFDKVIVLFLYIKNIIFEIISSDDENFEDEFNEYDDFM